MEEEKQDTPKEEKNQAVTSNSVLTAPNSSDVKVTQQELILRNGVYHERVILLKKNLAILGFVVQGSNSDHYGPLTTDQVRAFQRSRGLVETGEVNSILESQIDQLANGPLRIGMYREDVVSLKKLLLKAGFFLFLQTPTLISALKQKGN